MAQEAGGLAGWLLKRLRGRKSVQPRLALLDRIALAPRQSLALVEAEGRRILVATSPEGGPAFFALDDETERIEGLRGVRLGEARASAKVSARVSW